MAHILDLQVIDPPMEACTCISLISSMFADVA